MATGDVVTVTYNEERKYRETSRQVEPPFLIFFEDEHLLVVEKPAPWLTVPTPKGETDTLVNHIKKYLSRGRKHAPQIEVVQRLDRGVSGVLVFGKTQAVGKKLAKQFALTKPDREYVALVAGRVEAEQGSFDQWLITDKTSLQRRVAPRPGVSAVIASFRDRNNSVAAERALPTASRSPVASVSAAGSACPAARNALMASLTMPRSPDSPERSPST